MDLVSRSFPQGMTDPFNPSTKADLSKTAKDQVRLKISLDKPFTLLTKTVESNST